MQFYRAVSQAELEDILASGQFRSNPNGFTFGKWFALEPDAAATWGRWFGSKDRSMYTVVTTAVPETLAVSLSVLPNLDDIGAAVIIENNQLFLLPADQLHPVPVSP